MFFLLVFHLIILGLKVSILRTCSCLALRKAAYIDRLELQGRYQLMHQAYNYRNSLSTDIADLAISQ